MTLCVVDASVALSWSFEDERTPYALAVLESLRRESAIAPAIWPLEFSNALLAAVSKGRIQTRFATRLIANLYQLPIDVDQEAAYVFTAQDILNLGLVYRLSAYDASYLEFAMRRGLPLATEDKRLAAAAVASGVEIFQP